MERAGAHASDRLMRDIGPSDNQQPTTNNQHPTINYHCNLRDGQCEPVRKSGSENASRNAVVTWQQFAETVPSPTSCRTPQKRARGEVEHPAVWHHGPHW